MDPMLRAIACLLFFITIGVGSTYSQEVGPTTVRFVSPIPDSSTPSNVKDLGYVEISGGIQRSAVPQVVAALLKAKKATAMRTQAGDPVIQVVLNSPGGEVAAAMEMGRLLRSHATYVWVDRGA